MVIVTASLELFYSESQTEQKIGSCVNLLYIFVADRKAVIVFNILQYKCIRQARLFFRGYTTSLFTEVGSRSRSRSRSGSRSRSRSRSR